MNKEMTMKDVEKIVENFAKSADKFEKSVAKFAVLSGRLRAWQKDGLNDLEKSIGIIGGKHE